MDYDEGALLVEQARGGNRAAMEQLCTHLYRIVRARIHDEEGVQRGVCAIYANLHRLSQPRALVSWSQRVAINAVISDHKKRQPESITDEALNTHGCEPFNDFDEQEEAAVRAEQVRDAMSLLSEQSRRVLEAHYWDGLTVREAADKLGIHRSVYFRQLQDAREEIRTILLRRVDMQPMV